MTQASPLKPPQDLVELGRVLGSYGLRGWVKVEPFSAEPDVLLSCREWWIRRSADGRVQPCKVSQVRAHGSSLVAAVEGLQTREAAEAWRGARVLASRSLFPKAQADEYYWVDLLGCEVWGREDERDVRLGIVHEVSDNGAHAVLHVQCMSTESPTVPLKDVKGRDRFCLVPFVAAHVERVDLVARTIHTNWPPDV